jgi:hypothetical protein
LLRPTRYETDHDYDNFAEGRAIEIRVVFKWDSGSASAGRPRRLAREAGALPCQSHFWTGQPHHGPAAGGGAGMPVGRTARHSLSAPIARTSRKKETHEHGRTELRGPGIKRFLCHFGE